MDMLVTEEQYLVDEIALPLDKGQAIARGIQDGTARAVSDGSFKDNYGTAAGVIAATATDKDMLYFSNVVPGTSTDQSSYRSELSGVLGLLHIIEAICSTFKITQGSVTIALDGREAMTQASYTNVEQPLQAGQVAFDLLQTIRHTCSTLPIKVQWRWVEGHQLEKGKRLDWWGNQNRIVDAMAKRFWESCNQKNTPNDPRPLRNEQFLISKAGTKLSRFHKKQLYDQIFGKRTLSYWESKRQFASQHSTMIMWPEAKLALDRLPFGKKRFWTKFTTGFIGTAKKMKQRNQTDTDNCPRCKNPAEDNIHVLQCPDATASDLWATHIQALQTELYRMKTAPTIIATIVNNLLAWRENKPPYFPSSNNWGEHDAAHAQHLLLGWNNFVFGRWHYSWANAQQTYLTSIGSRLSIRRWTTAIIHKLLLTAWDMWDHRNRVLHSLTGDQRQTETHQLDQAILEELNSGYADLFPLDTHLVQAQERNQQILTGTIASKKKWLASVRLSRQLAQQQNTQDPARATLQRQQQLMQRWLHHSS
jgi:ribonuclease HI